MKKRMKTGMQDAENALHWNIIDGLEVNSCRFLKIFNYLPVVDCPNSYSDKRIVEFIFQHTLKYKANILRL